MIHVTQTYLPDQEKYQKYLSKIWESGWITNNGQMVLELEARLRKHTGVAHFAYCNNGTIALQIALKALNITKEVITTPFSYVATTNAILWENCRPVFVDINESDFNIDVSKIEKQITKDTQAILVTHVFGNPCDVDEIERIANKHKLKIIYDAAHAFGVFYNNKSLVSHGDISTCSFHATKIFHTVEGGAIICKDEAIFEKVFLMRQFGHIGNDYYLAGINGKCSEFHAAMGLCVLEDMDIILNRRKAVIEYYNLHLNRSALQRPVPLAGTSDNFAYYAVVFQHEDILNKVMNALQENSINPRRYFYPSLNELPFLPDHPNCPTSESISKRILCLPLSTYLTEDQLKLICETINQNL